jgi:tRNA(Ile)-lysidine synthase
MILEKFKTTIARCGLIQKGDKIAVGVSGGPDSVALLYLLNNLKKEFNLTLHIAHLDHMLRPDSSSDAKFVRALGEKLKIPATFAQINVKELAKKGSIEEIARNARLGFFFRVAKEVKAKKIALGHNLDDQAETVLMRILRGSGLYGLSGILPKREIAGFTIIRPLIEVRRREIERFLEKKKIKPCRDISNQGDIYFRNKIRNRLLPLLEKEYNKNIREVLANMAQNIGCDYAYLSSQALLGVKKLGRKINLKNFSKLHLALQRVILRFMIKRLKGDIRRITFQHIKEIEDMLQNRPSGSIVHLPGNIRVTKKKPHLIFAINT